ncbi:MAG: translocation/assembly module TamB domain-containing protein [Leadbetterella sp.]
MKKSLIIGFKVTRIVVITVLVLLFALYLALQSSEIQTAISQEAFKKLSEKLGGNVSVSRTRISWFDEIVFEDVNIQDLQGKNMIFVRELYINCKTNFSFDLEKIIKFDNNLDYVLLKDLDVTLTKSEKGRLNIDDWIARVQALGRDSTKPKKKAKPFTIDAANIQNGRIMLVDPFKNRSPKEVFDHSNFTFSDINASLSNVLLYRDTVQFKAANIVAEDKRSQLKIHKLKTDFFYNKFSLKLDKLYAEINNSILKDKVHFYYDKPSAFNKFFTKIDLNINLKKSKLYSKDIARFAPYMYKIEDNYIVTTQITGKYVDLFLKNADISFGDKSYVKGNFAFKGLPKLSETQNSYDIERGFITASDFRRYYSDAKTNAVFTTLESVDMSGSFKGLFSNFNSDIKAYSPGVGNLSGKLSMKNPQTMSAVEYSSEINAQSFDLGKLINLPTLKKIDFQGQLSGKGFTGVSSIFNIKGKIPEVSYGVMNYENIEVDGKLSESIFEGYLGINDPKIKGNIDGHIEFKSDNKYVKIKGKVDDADLQKLGFLKMPIRGSSYIDFDFSGNKPDDFEGSAIFKDAVIKSDKKVFNIDNADITSKVIGGQRDINLRSNFLDFNLKGDFVPTQLFSDFKRLTKEYLMYFTQSSDYRNSYYEGKQPVLPIKSNGTFFCSIKNSDPLLDFILPGLSISEGAEFKGNLQFDTTQNITIYGQMDSLKYLGNRLYKNKLNFTILKELNSPKVISSLNFNSLDQKLFNGVETHFLDAKSFWDESNLIRYTGALNSIDSENRGVLSGSMQFTPKGLEGSIDGEKSELFLLNQKWGFGKKNQYKISGKEIEVENMSIVQNDKVIRLDGLLSKNPKKEMVLNLRDVDLSTIKPLTNVTVNGMANGEFRLRDFYGSRLLTSDIHIEDLEYKKVEFGTLTFSSDYDNDNEKVNLKSSLYKNLEELVRFSGVFDPKKKSNPLDAKAKVKNANLSMFKKLMEGVFTDLDGDIEGDFTIKGRPTNPVILGEASIKNGKLNILASGTKLYFQDKIIVNEKGFFTGSKGIGLTDGQNVAEKARLYGGIVFLPNRKFGFELNANISNNKEGFKVIDLKEAENAVFYGQAFAHGDVLVRGDFDNIIISGNLTSKRNTKMTIPLDGSQVVDIKQDGIPFIKKYSIQDTSLQIKPKLKSSGVSLGFNLNFTPEAECEIIFDRLNKDILDVYGSGRITINYDTRGGFTMTGPYEVQSGRYDFSFQNLASLRKFNLMPGSRITWSGDPYEANIDMKATYLTSVPINKVVNQGTDVGSTGNQRYPVNVIVHMTERLLTPTIKYNVSFDLKQIPLIHQSYILGFEENLRNDEQQMSRNVSSILVFNDLFPETVADAITQQFLIDNVSNLLSNQIGSLASKLNSNLELGVQFGDFRQNVLNNLQLNFSYKFFDNRFKVSGKSTYISSLEDAQNPEAARQLSIGGELEYLLSADGQYRFKLFSRSVPTNFYTFSATGNVIVSGGNLVISRNFSRFNLQRKSKAIPLGVGKDPNGISYFTIPDSSKLAF